MLMTVEQALVLIPLCSVAIGVWIGVRVPRLIARWLDRDETYQGQPKDQTRVKRNGR